MEVKFVYVLTSNSADSYYEQFFLSVTSLRLHNSGATIVVLVDKKTKAGLTGIRAGYEKTVSEIIIIAVPEEFTQKEASRWIKTSINRYVTGDFLFIDCDTIITGKLATIFAPNIRIGAVLDCHVPLSKHHLQEHFQQEDEQAGFCSSLQFDVRYNGGLILYRNTSESNEFFEKWHSLWLKSRKRGNAQDMPALNQANYELHGVITELGGKWNCQISHNGLPYLHNAKIIHYYATSLASFAHPYTLASESVLSSIKKTGTISPEILRLLYRPKTAFSPNVRIIADHIALDVLESAFFSKLLWLRRTHRRIFNTLDAFIARVKKVKYNKHT
ncbi:glycosyltransferase [Treponema endosymbiont of Eucomonympha sp.]|uniref:glycosyltransferase n=1 Tax=Treponema endosymbiont of Eucomonympha sp. TaxID=1580831 RepID=UPI00075083AB|nr:glycosyltransferase [Treponema endosymbiont of Eucomonympha sp.]